MLIFLDRKKPSRPRLFSERGQGVALLLLALAVLFAACARAKGLL